MEGTMMRGILWVEEAQDWNEERDNLAYNTGLELAMLDEEVEEYMVAALEDDAVGQADALADILIVATGSLYKLVGGDKYKFDDIMLAVTAANNNKSYLKNGQGKIIKNVGFVGPELVIKGILDD